LEALSLRAHLVRRLYRRQWRDLSEVRLQQAVAELARGNRTRFTIIDPRGKVLADSHHDPTAMENHANRPEIRAALQGHEKRSTRYSRTLQQEMTYFAVPVQRDDGVVAVVRTAIGMQHVSATLSELLRRIAAAGLIVALLVSLVHFFVARRLVRPLREMQQGAARFANGELRYRLPVPWTAEAGALAESMNQMAAQLHERIRLVTRQRNQLEAVLGSMIEAVLVVDARGRILQINQAAVALFDLDPSQSIGGTLEVAVGHEELQDLMRRLLQDERTVEGDIVLERGGPRYLRVIGTRLRDAAGQRLGAMVVLHDVTQLKRLESIRRDFVANVSHELKTPVTSIQGFVETLRDGAIDDPDTARRFLDIITRHAERLNAIIEDLLSLSRIEIEGGAGAVPLEPQPVFEVLRAVVGFCQPKARDRRIRLALEGDPDLRAAVNAPLLEQAVVNLIDNAIKYSDPESHVRVGIHQQDDDVVISVTDDGPGIPPRAPVADLRALLPGGQGPQPGGRRHRARPRHRQAHHRGPPRPGVAGVLSGRGQHLPAPDPGRARRRALRPSPVSPYLWTCGAGWAPAPGGRRHRVGAGAGGPPGALIIC
jgi:two-component system phosphate regulon sensor histidine kinase PhoR